METSSKMRTRCTINSVEEEKHRIIEIKNKIKISILFEKSNLPPPN